MIYYRCIDLNDVTLWPLMVHFHSQLHALRLGFTDFPDPLNQSVENIALMKDTIALIQRKWQIAGSYREGVFCRATLCELDRKMHILTSQSYRNKSTVWITLKHLYTVSHCWLFCMFCYVFVCVNTITAEFPSLVSLSSSHCIWSEVQWIMETL